MAEKKKNQRKTFPTHRTHEMQNANQHAGSAGMATAWLQA